jgi:hypothetical protein
VTLARDAWGNVHAYLEPERAAGCTDDVQLGVVDQATPDTIAPAANVLVEALAAARACVETKPPLAVPAPNLPPKAPPPEVDPIRIQALHAALDRVPSPDSRWLGAALELTSAITIALLEPPPAARHDPAARTFRAWGGAMLFGGAVGTLTVTPNRSLDFNAATVFAGFGFYAAGSLFGGDSFARGASAGGFFVSASLAAANFVRPRPLTRLNADDAEVSRTGLTKQRAAAIERDLDHADPWIPRWLVFTPIIASSTLAAAHLIATKQTDTSLLVINVTFAGGFAVAAIIDAATGSIRGSYERALRAAGLKQLSLAPGPTPLGVSLVGRF